jgi:hypothetical protein
MLIYLSTYPPICLSAYLSICLSAYLAIYQPGNTHEKVLGLDIIIQSGSWLQASAMLHRRSQEHPLFSEAAKIKS